MLILITVNHSNDTFTCSLLTFHFSISRTHDLQIMTTFHVNEYTPMAVVIDNHLPREPLSFHQSCVPVVEDAIRVMMVIVSPLSYKHKVRLTLTVTLSNITRRWLETSQSGYHICAWLHCVGVYRLVMEDAMVIISTLRWSVVTETPALTTRPSVTSFSPNTRCYIYPWTRVLEIKAP